MTLFAIVLIPHIFFTVCIGYAFWYHKRQHSIQETYEERVELAKQGVEVGLGWIALEQSDEIRVYELGPLGGAYYITRKQAKEELMQARAREYITLKVREEKYKADIKEKDATLRRWSDRAHELSKRLGELSTEAVISQYSYTTKSGKKSKGKKK